MYVITLCSNLSVSDSSDLHKRFSFFVGWPTGTLLHEHNLPSQSIPVTSVSVLNAHEAPTGT